MGNICSRSANKPESFSGPGRVVGTAPTGQSAPRAPVPAKNNWKNTPGRTLGESAQNTQGGGDEARSNAAIAAQKRAEGTSVKKGKLGSKLATQKAQTQSQTLNEASQTERAARDADGAEQARRWE